MAIVLFSRRFVTRLTLLGRRTSVGLIGLVAIALGCTRSSATDPFLPSGDRLKFQTQITNVVAGQLLAPFKIQIVDTGGAVVSRENVDIALSLDSTDPRDTLFGQTVVATTRGEALFVNVFLKRSVASMRVVATARGLTGAVSLPFAISVGTPAKLAFKVQPSAVVAGEKMVPPPQVVVQDAVGNLIANDSGLVVLQVLTGPSTAPRNATVSAVNGVARYDSLRIVTAAPSFTLTAVGPAGRNLAAAVSTVFSVTPGAAAKLFFQTQPSTSVVNTAMSPAVTVAVADTMSNIVTSFTGPVALAFDINPTGATLGGTTTVSAISGVATFSGLSINLTSGGTSGYRLRATAAAVPADTARSGFFSIVP